MLKLSTHLWTVCEIFTICVICSFCAFRELWSFFAICDICAFYDIWTIWENCAIYFAPNKSILVQDRRGLCKMFPTYAFWIQEASIGSYRTSLWGLEYDWEVYNSCFRCSFVVFVTYEWPWSWLLWRRYGLSLSHSYNRTDAFDADWVTSPLVFQVPSTRICFTTVSARFWLLSRSSLLDWKGY